MDTLGYLFNNPISKNSTLKRIPKSLLLTRQMQIKMSHRLDNKRIKGQGSTALYMEFIHLLTYTQSYI